MKTYTTTELAEILELNRLHAIGDPSGKRANLTDAILTDANLTNAHLTNTNLRGAYLSGAYLSGAYLSGADLSGADLSGAYLSGADLSGANLTNAYLTDAILSGATLPDGTKWEQYLSETVPELLVAGGKTIAEIIESGTWQCHDWTNCPMHTAFGINRPEEGPILLRPRITEFVQFYDAGLVPCPVVGEVE